MVKHERVCSVPHTDRAEEAVGKGVTRYTSQWCVHRPAADNPQPRVSDPGIVSQSDLGVGTRGWPLTIYPRTIPSTYDVYHLHI